MLSQKLHNTYKISGTVAVICIFEHPDDLIWKNSKHESSPESKNEELSFTKFFHMTSSSDPKIPNTATVSSVFNLRILTLKILILSFLLKT